MEMQIRSSPGGSFRAAEQDGERTIEAYFAVFGDTYEMFPGCFESIDPHAFDDALSDDVRCLVDHDSLRVLGRTKSGTLTLAADNYGLKGVVKINADDQDALNLYARVQRGDVSQGSFGFDILSEDTDYKPDGSVHWTIKAVKLYEVSVVTFPAYEKTEAAARGKRAAQAFDAWQKRMKERLQNGTKTDD